MKKMIIFLLTLIMVFCLNGCRKKDTHPDSSSAGSQTTVSKQYKDGEYKASAPSFDDSGYKATVKVVVKDGTIYSVDCDAEHKDDGTKKSISESGKYGMKKGGAQYEWHEEIAFFEKHVASKGLDNIPTDTEGRTNVISGCTIKVKDYIELINEALAKAEK